MPIGVFQQASFRSIAAQRIISSNFLITTKPEQQVCLDTARCRIALLKRRYLIEWCDRIPVSFVRLAAEFDRFVKALRSASTRPRLLCAFASFGSKVTDTAL